MKSKPIVEAQAEGVLSKYTIPELPEIKPTPDVILAHEVSEDKIRFGRMSCNMNLIRNHIIYYKRQISELCEQNGLKS